MARGAVVYFNNEDGYGFIETDDADDDVFFHVTDISGLDTQEGDEFQFVIESGDRGPRVADIHRQ